MNTAELIHYFSKQKPSDISWAHACNTKSKVGTALQNDVDFLEVDIRVNSETGLAGLAHSVGDVFELSIEELLKLLAGQPKGLKLDFKEQAAVEQVLSMVAAQRDELGPIIINADVLPGPGAQKQGLSLIELVKVSQNILPEGILSVGWINQIVEAGSYTEEHVNAMLTALSQTGWLGDVTFAVRAHYLPVSWEALQLLLSKPGYTLTIWNNEDVPVVLQKWIKKNVPPEKAFVDLYKVDSGEAIHLF